MTKKKDYKCSECGLEIVIYKEENHELPEAECQGCHAMTMRPIGKTVPGEDSGGVITEMSFSERCDLMRKQIGKDAQIVKYLRDAPIFKSEEQYSGQHDEMKANITLAYRHLEDARMRIGKILQAAGDGISILDK